LYKQFIFSITVR